MSRNQGRIINLEKGAVRIYLPSFFESILYGTTIGEKLFFISDDNYATKEDDGKNKPLSYYIQEDSNQENKDTSSFDEILEDENEDRVLPFILNKKIYEVEEGGGKKEKEKYFCYVFKGVSRKSSFTTDNKVKNIIDFYYDAGEPYMKNGNSVESIDEFQYSIFSRDDGHPFKDMMDKKSQPFVNFLDKTLIFYQPTQLFRTKGAENYIQKARDKAFAYFAYLGIPIVIKITGAKIDPKYFINVWKSPFIRYPELSKIINMSDNEFIVNYSTFSSPNESGKKKKEDKDKENVHIILEYRGLQNLEFGQNKIKKSFGLPLAAIQKTIPYFPDYTKYYNLKVDSLLPVYHHFSEIIDRIRTEINFNANLTDFASDGDNNPYDDYVNVISYLELGYTPMNSELPRMESEIKIDTNNNFLSYLNQEKNVSSIMEIATKKSKSLFLPMEPGGVQIFTGKSSKWHMAYYTRNKNSIMANANAIAAGLRTSNVVIVPVTPSHVSSFLESIDCAFINWNRFGLAKYNMLYNQPNSNFSIKNPKLIVYFESNQRPFDADMTKKIIQFHCAKYAKIFTVGFAESEAALSTYIDEVNEIDERYRLCKLELMYSIAAFATVNDCADFLDLNDSYEGKSSFAFNQLD